MATRTPNGVWSEAFRERDNGAREPTTYALSPFSSTEWRLAPMCV